MCSQLEKRRCPLQKTVDAVISAFNNLSVFVRKKNIHVYIKDALMEKDVVDMVVPLGTL